MQFRFFFLLSVFLMVLSIAMNGQKPIPVHSYATVIKYDTITIYDTVHIYDTIKIPEKSDLNYMIHKSFNWSLLQVDTSRHIANLLVFSNNSAATIPINSIILSDNLKKNYSMKTMNFFGVVFFAFQSMVMAQTQFGISVGNGLWWANCNQSTVNSELSLTVSNGIFLEVPIKDHLFLKSEFNYSYMMSNGSYKTYVDPAHTISLGDGESASVYHQISIPLMLGYQFDRFKPLLGVEYAHRISESWLHAKMNLVNLAGGINYSLNDRFSLELVYYQGLTKDFEFRGTITDQNTSEVIGEYDDYWKSSRVGLSLHYSFSNKNKAVKAEE